MPYTMMIYSGEYEKLEIPKEGDIFVVARVIGDVTDMHWGMGTHIELQPIRIESEEIDAKSKQVEE